MSMVIIADAGSSKTDWLIQPGPQSSPVLVSTEGINPSVMTVGQLEDRIRAFKDELEGKLGPVQQETLEMHYFGAGCNSAKVNDRLHEAFLRLFPALAGADFHSDLEGAAIALFGAGRGIACILGTGSASACFDGRKILDSVPSLGFILGDEGSGAFMGKELLNRYFKRNMSAETATLLEEHSDVAVVKVIENVYRKPAPNKYLASFVPFIKANESNDEISLLIDDCLKLFFDKNVLKYKDIDQYKRIGFVGGVANAFSHRICRLADYYGFEVESFLRKPIFALGDFYNNNNPLRK